MSQVIAIGGDVSKGRLDVVILSQSGTVLTGSGAYDDTHSGHTALREHIRRLETVHPDAEIRAAVESTGGYERNWLKLFRDEGRRGKRVKHTALNPLAVKKWLESDLHRVVDDRAAAHGIAAYLLTRTGIVCDVEPTPYQASYRLVRAAIADRAVLAQQLQLALNQVNPELVSACRSGIPTWLIAVLGKYPTAALLARARPATLAAITHVGDERARVLIDRAATSVASSTGLAAAFNVTMLIERMCDLDASIERYSTRLIAALTDDPRVALLDSITGIGEWTATALVLEIGDIARFDSVRSLIAWAGLDAHTDESGDGVIRRGISKRGNAHLRGLLYMPTLCARIYNPVIKAFYERLTGRGSPHLVASTAAMGKLLRIVYAVLVTGAAFDPDYEAKRAQRNHQRRANTDTAPVAAPAATAPASDLTAPISRREAARRRARADQTNAAAPAAPCTGSESQEATRADRDDSMPDDAPPATDQAAPCPIVGRHAGAIHPTKTASVGPSKGPQRCRPTTGRGAAASHARKGEIMP